MASRPGCDRVLLIRQEKAEDRLCSRSKGVSGAGSERRPETDLGCGRLAEKLLPPPVERIHVGHLVVIDGMEGGESPQHLPHSRGPAIPDDTLRGSEKEGRLGIGSKEADRTEDFDGPLPLPLEGREEENRR